MEDVLALGNLSCYSMWIEKDLRTTIVYNSTASLKRRIQKRVSYFVQQITLYVSSFRKQHTKKIKWQSLNVNRSGICHNHRSKLFFVSFLQIQQVRKVLLKFLRNGCFYATQCRMGTPQVASYNVHIQVTWAARVFCIR